jgi:hypothetical protein
MQIPPVEGNFKEGGKAVKPLSIEDYTAHMGYVDLNDRMAKSYSIINKTWKWTKNSLFVGPNHSEFINSLQILWGKCDPSEIMEQLVRDLIVLSQEDNTEILGVQRGQCSSLEQFGDSNEPTCKTFLTLADQRKRATSCVPNEETKQKKKKTVCYCKKCNCGQLCCAMLQAVVCKNPTVTGTDCTNI